MLNISYLLHILIIYYKNNFIPLMNNRIIFTDTLIISDIIIFYNMDMYMFVLHFYINIALVTKEDFINIWHNIIIK